MATNEVDISDLPAPAADISDLPPPPGPPLGFGDIAKGTGQAALALGSGALKGVNLAANDILPEWLGGAGSRQNLKSQIEKDPVMNYHPSNPVGQNIMGFLGDVTAPVGKVLGGVHDTIAGLTSPRTADVLGDIATLAPGFRGATAPLEEASAIEEGHPLSEAAKEVRSSLGSVKSNAEGRGYVLPEQGTREAHAAAAATNTPLVNADARAELNLPKGADLYPELLDKARAANAGPAYQAIRELPDKIPLTPQYEATFKDAADLLPPRIRAKIPESGDITGQEAVDLSKMLRNRASVVEKSPNFNAAGDSPQEIAAAHRDLAKSIEDSVKDHLSATGREGMADDWNSARIYTAKSYSVQDALDGAGNVRASELRKDPLVSGRLKEVSTLAGQYPEAFKTTRVTAPSVGMARRVAGAVAPLGGATIGGYLGGGPGAAGGEYVGERIRERLLSPK